MSDEYVGYREAPEGEGLAELRRLADELEAAQEEVVRLEVLLKNAQEKATELSEITIPEKMAAVGLTELATPSGFRLAIEEAVFAHITKAREDEAYRWLDVNGHGGMIRRELTVAFNREQGDAATALHAELRGKFAGVTQKWAVNAQTLKAWARHMLEDGENVPLETFGIHTKRVAKIKK